MRGIFAGLILKAEFYSAIFFDLSCKIDPVCRQAGIYDLRLGRPEIPLITGLFEFITALKNLKSKFDYLLS
jgi:hypothetical protein